MISENNPRKLDIEKRRARVVKLRRESLSLEAIAKRLNVSVSTVWADLAATRKNLEEFSRETYRTYRDEMLERAEMIMAETLKCWRKDKNLKALERYQAMFNQACKITGIEAPIKIAETDTDGNSLTYDGERSYLDSLLAEIAGGNRIAGELGESEEN